MRSILYERMLRLPSNQPSKSSLNQWYLKPAYVCSMTATKLFWLTCSALICQRYTHSRIILGINIHIISSTGRQIMQSVGSHFSHKKLPGLIWTLNKRSIKNRERKNHDYMSYKTIQSLTHQEMLTSFFSKTKRIDFLNFSILQCCKQNIHIVLHTIVQCLFLAFRKTGILFEGHIKQNSQAISTQISAQYHLIYTSS